MLDAITYGKNQLNIVQVSTAENEELICEMVLLNGILEEPDLIGLISVFNALISFPGLHLAAT